MVRAFAGDSTMTSRRRAPSELTSSVLATVLLVVVGRRLSDDAGSAADGHRWPPLVGHSDRRGARPPRGPPAGGSPTSPRSGASRRCPTIRYAGPSARGPTSTPATPAAASAAPTASQAGWSFGPSANVYIAAAGAPVAQPSDRHHQRSRAPSSAQPVGGTFTAPSVQASAIPRSSGSHGVRTVIPPGSDRSSSPSCPRADISASRASDRQTADTTTLIRAPSPRRTTWPDPASSPSRSAT